MCMYAVRRAIVVVCNPGSNAIVKYQRIRRSGYEVKKNFENRSENI